MIFFNVSALPAMMPPTVATIPASGGVISISSQEKQGNLSFSLLIPDQFFTSSQTVTVNMFDEISIQAAPTLRNNDLEAQIAGPIFDISTVVQTSTKSATLLLPYRSTKSKRGDDTYLFRIYYFDDLNDVWIASESSVDNKDSLTVSTNTSHFSLWTVISSKRPPKESAVQSLAAVDWRLALYIGLPFLGLILVYIVARLIYAKHKHVKNSRYEFRLYMHGHHDVRRHKLICFLSDAGFTCNQCSKFNKKMPRI